MVKLSSVIVIVAVVIVAIVLVQNYTGAAVTYKSCIDSDNGKTYNTYGYTTTVNSNNITGMNKDACASKPTYNLIEYYCSGAKPQAAFYKCASGCKDGACPCTDTDGGAKYDVKGTVTNATGQFTDNCDAVGAPNYLNEFVCAGGAGRIDCTATGKTCQDGACVQPAAPACVDTDGSWNNATKGTKTNVTGQYTDYCSTNTFLIEFECAMEQSLGYYLKSCNCANGACV